MTCRKKDLGETSRKRDLKETYRKRDLYIKRPTEKET